ncbi:hypothetical protein [Natronorubrum daqingense]|nr:hypothetical protein [Natronorubrum daqingense]APX98746.1 hypothetical protein BB347_18750 [Natronorubrum daqingense]
MPATKTQPDESSDRPSLERAQYARYDHWGEDDEDEQLERTGHSELRGTTKEDSFSHLWLKQTSEGLLDPIALNEPPEDGLHEYEGEVIELSDAAEYPPTRNNRKTPQTQMQKKAPSTRRWRISEVGHVTFGGIIPDRGKDELRDLIDYVTANMNNVSVPPRNRREIRDRAMRMKESGRYHDTQIMRQVATWVLNPNELRDDN